MRDANQWPELIGEIEANMSISEVDYDSAERARDEAAARCEHAHACVEEAPYAGRIYQYVVCPDCGAENGI